ncbi:hypothetical protein L249_2827 [Ophiocordyceps polyrhachis-furcata BCC 54312]|uniref:Fungal-type protein kinase domain-containing protein n=1 Tax=Ophiocordyceps polyrhachis-furcata BCC 54312 TaxID=1330021 RepID=A0A367LPD1_9HYPO|nr:hypothetical protein L249_2827 [Ophiocordyceps polyrhachis-furcata BCC 54312]
MNINIAPILAFERLPTPSTPEATVRPLNGILTRLWMYAGPPRHRLVALSLIPGLMATLSEDDRDIVARHPLDNSLDCLTQTLQDVEDFYISISGLLDDSEKNFADNHQKTICRLLSALMGTEAGLSLRSATSSRHVSSELALIYARVRNGDFDYSYYRPLVRLILQKASDFEIWNAVLHLIATLTKETPPASVAATFDSTPIIHSSASLQGSEQTRELVERKIFKEIRLCTYRDVEGFFEKYFEGKDWTRRALDTYEAAKNRHVDGAWAGLPDPPVQAEVLDWWFRFQDDFLSEEQRRYYSTTSPKDLIGAQAQRQLDLFVKRSNRQQQGGAHDWRDVEVIGELKASIGNKKATLLQIGRYVRDVFSCQPTRRYVHAFTICGREMEIWVFDRSGCYSPGAFDIHEKPKRFIQVIAGYTMMNDEELGLDIFTERDRDGLLIQIEPDGASGMKKLRLEPQPFTHQRAIVCRGTTCYLTKPQKSENWSSVAKFSWTSDRRKPEADILRLARQRGVEGIATLIGHRRITSINEIRSGLSFSKPYSFRSPAPTFSQFFSRSQPPNALSRSFSGLPGLSIANKPLKKRKLVDVGQKPSKLSRSSSQRSSQRQNEVVYDVEETQGTSLLDPMNGPFDNRVFRCLVISPAGRAIHKYDKKSELLEALRDAVKAHRSLYLKGEILHRDVSENNIIITDRKTTGYVGMLIDLDLAKELGSGRSGARCRTGTMEFMAIEVLRGISHTYRHDLESFLYELGSGRSGARCRTGTMEFMAIEVLRGISHTYRHDLESFLYVLLWLCGRRGWELVNRARDHPTYSMFTSWYTGSFRQIASVKLGHMDANGFEYILEEFPQPEFDSVKPLCRDLRRIFISLQGRALYWDPERFGNSLWANHQSIRQGHC